MPRGGGTCEARPFWRRRQHQHDLRCAGPAAIGQRRQHSTQKERAQNKITCSWELDRSRIFVGSGLAVLSVPGRELTELFTEAVGVGVWACGEFLACSTSRGGGPDREPLAVGMDEAGGPSDEVMLRVAAGSADAGCCCFLDLKRNAMGGSVAWRPVARW